MTTLYQVASGVTSEGSVHRNAKDRMVKMVSDGSLTINAEIDGRWCTFVLDTSWAPVVDECEWPSGKRVANADAYYAANGRWPEMILDVGLLRNGRVEVGIEIVKTHGLTPRKRSKIIDAGFLCLLIKADQKEWLPDQRRVEAYEIIGSSESTRLLERVSIGHPP